MDTLKTIGKAALIIVLLPFAIAVGALMGALMILFLAIYTPIHMILSVWHWGEENKPVVQTDITIYEDAE